MEISKKNIISCIVFLLGLVCLLALTSVVFRPKDNRESYGMEETRANGILGEPEQTLDVVFIGDSISYCSIVPVQMWRDHGLASYVCATSLQKLYYSREFLDKVFDTQSPQIVVLGTSAIFNEFEQIDGFKNRIENKIPIFRYHDRWKKANTFLEYDTSLEVNYTYQEVAKGYYYTLAAEEIEVGDYTKTTDVVEQIPSNCRKMVKKIKEICDENNAKLLLLSEPNASGAWGPHRHNAIKLLAEEMGLEYLDLNYMQEEVPIEWATESFDTGDHLNYYGAKKVTAYLGKYFSEMGIFKDHRNDERYASWHQAEKAFYEMAVE